MPKISATNIEGAFPALDRKKVAKPYVVAGQNFLVDLDGPKSAFGCEKSYDKFTPKHLAQSFRVGSEIFYFTRDVAESYLQVSKVDWPARQVVPAGKFVSADLGRPKRHWSLYWSKSPFVRADGQ